SIVNLIQRPGFIRIGFDDLLSALRPRNGRCLFGYGESDSDNRAHEALTQALKNPLMDRGRMLSDATNVLVQVAGGPGMTLSEVEILMQELCRHVSDQTQILFGAAVDGRLGDKLSVTIISSLAAEEESVSRPREPGISSSASVTPTVVEQHEPVQAKIEIEAQEIVIEPAPPEEDTPFEEPAMAEAPPAAIPAPSIPKPVISRPPEKSFVANKEKAPAEKSAQAKQEILQFEPVTRGRFEKSEPTIVEGEDLDVPTFLRKNIKVK